MKKILSMILMVMVLMVAVIGCSKDDKKESGTTDVAKAGTETKSSESKTYKIGVAGSSFADKWQTYLYDAVQAKADTMSDVEVLFADGKDDPATQLANVENFIAQKVDAILIVMVDPSSPKPFLKLSEESGIPLIGVNRTFEGSDYYVGSESIDAGLIQMEKVAELLNGKGTIALLQGAAGHEAALNRTAGNKQIMEKHPDMKLFREEIGNWDRAKAVEITENWLQLGEKIDAIVANNDEMAIGAARVLKANGLIDSTVVAGIDATPDALEYVQNGELDVTVFQSPFGQGEVGLDTAVKVAKGENVESIVWVPFELVTKDNVDEYIAKWK